ncbi:hypothetical protein Tco_1442255, partial [Tanacetum coccineum]
VLGEFDSDLTRECCLGALYGLSQSGLRFKGLAKEAGAEELLVKKEEMGTDRYGIGLVSWSSKKQRSTAISTTEAEYIAMSGCCAQILWIKTTGLTLIKFFCTVITKVLLLFAVTTSSTLALNTLTYGTISSESKWKIEWLNSTSWKRIINLQTSSPKHYQENGSNFFFHA